jgi:hypothetical protein
MHDQPQKDPPLRAVLARLEQDLGAAAFVVTDHWQDDLCATGISSPVNSRILAYLSIWQRPPDYYYLELEAPGESDDRDDYVVAGRWESIGYAELRERVVQHLASAKPG